MDAGHFVLVVALVSTLIVWAVDYNRTTSRLASTAMLLRLEEASLQNSGRFRQGIEGRHRKQGWRD
jgi:hypothetical protein